MNELDFVRIALKRQIAMKPIEKKYKKCRWWFCPTCYPDAPHRVYKTQCYCSRCGQFLNWD